MTRKTKPAAGSPPTNPALRRKQRLDARRCAAYGCMVLTKASSGLCPPHDRAARQGGQA